ncbi:unnamed protein product [Haemonchus placei]|uniref:Uncharacterized protein n=1 Tax=Haemonchus placei TaxID=6290 RepID=A0A0N4X2Z0_HAEPC|nr:unnamed protein product [Haemonchus placei]
MEGNVKKAKEEQLKTAVERNESGHDSTSTAPETLTTAREPTRAAQGCPVSPERRRGSCSEFRELPAPPNTENDRSPRRDKGDDTASDGPSNIRE